MYDLVVLGGGPGGLSVAKAAARSGARVALVEKDRLGGECTHSACVPSKALIQSARVAHLARSAADYGVRVGPVEVDFAAVMARVQAIVAEFAGDGSGDSLRAIGIEVFRGSPAFEAYDTVLIDGRTRLPARRFVIATGSRPAIPEIPGLDGSGYLDNRSVWGLTERPESLLILGGGPSGVEFAQAFARLGVRVTLMADSDRILTREDPEVSEAARAALADDGVTIEWNADVTRVERQDGRTLCHFDRKNGGATGRAEGAQLLIATGRKPNIEGLDLDAAGVHADPEHGIEVDEYLRTRSARTYALGDVLMRDQYTHAAEREADVVFRNAVLGLRTKFDDSAIPRAVFIDPEVASVGPDEAEAARRWPEARPLRAEFRDLDRAKIDGRTRGFGKVLALPSGRVVAASVVGEQASMIVQEFALAIAHGLTLRDLAETAHTYPTYAGLAQKLAHQSRADRPDVGPLRTALRWLFGEKPNHAEESPTHAEAAGPAH